MSTLNPSNISEYSFYNKYSLMYAKTIFENMGYIVHVDVE